MSHSPPLPYLIAWYLSFNRSKISKKLILTRRGREHHICRAWDGTPLYTLLSRSWCPSTRQCTPCLRWSRTWNDRTCHLSADRMWCTLSWNSVNHTGPEHGTWCVRFCLCDSKCATRHSAAECRRMRPPRLASCWLKQKAEDRNEIPNILYLYVRF